MYRLKGYDSFSGEYYNFNGEFSTYLEAASAARKQLQDLEASQASEQSGGQHGIQDHVYIVFPNGRLERVR